MNLSEQFDGLDFKSKNELDKAFRIFIEYSRDDAISQLKEYIQKIDPQENLYKVEVANIVDLLKAISEFNLLLGPQRIVEITPWHEIKDVDRKWLIPYWLPANTVTMFTGQGGAGKSWFTLQVICQIAGGFCEWACLRPNTSTNADPTPTYNVVLATYEDEPAEIKRRLQALASSMQWIEESLEAIKQHLHIVDMRGVGSIWGPGMGNHIANTGDLLTAGNDLLQICEDEEAHLLVIDPLSGAFGGNENDRTAVYDFTSSLRRWGDTNECAILIVGHLPKSKDARTAGYSGSTAWAASVRSMWLLSLLPKQTKDDECQYYALSHTKSNYARLQPEIPLIKSQNGWWQMAKNEEDAIAGYNAYKENYTEDTSNGYDDVKYSTSADTE